MSTAKRIVLGSGHVYVAEHQDGIEPTVESLKKDENELAKVSGGGSFTYTPTTYTAKSDDGKCQKTVITNEEATLDCGVCTVNGSLIETIVSTAKATAGEGKTVVSIGGVTNDNGKSYDILFYHTDAKDGDIAFLLAGKNTNGLSMSLTKDKETVTSLSFLAEPLDNGRLAIIEFYDADNSAATE